MKSGRLTEIIRIERGTEQINDAGTPVFTWAPVAQLFAEKIDQATAEAIRAFGAGEEEVIVFRARFVEGVGCGDRVEWRGDRFDIKQIAPIGRRHGLELRCVRVTP